MSAFPTFFAATITGDIGRLIAQALGACALLFAALWGQISLGNRALKMGQDIAFGTVAVMVWFIGVSQLISGHVSGLALVVVTILVGTALVDSLRRVTWARLLPIAPDDRMHMLGLVCLLFATAIFFLTSASVATPFGAPVDRASVYDTTRQGPNGGIAWSAFEGLPSARKNMGVAGINNTLYVVGGEDVNGPTTKVEAYDLGATGANAHWTGKAALPAPRTRLAVTAFVGKVYAIGGAVNGVPVATASVYDPNTDTWTELPPLPQPRADLAATVANGKIYAVGGTADTADADKAKGLATVFVYDPATRQWTDGPAMPTPRSALAVATIGNTLYALGGQDSGASLKTVEGLNANAQANTWAALPPMPDPRRNLAAVGVGDRTLYAIGGVGVAESTTTVQTFVLAQGKWAHGTELAVGRSGLGATAIDGKIYEIGGAGDQLGQIVPAGGLLFAIGESLIVGALAVALVGAGVRRTQRLASVREAKDVVAVGAGRNRGVIASSIPEETGPRMVGGVRLRWRRSPAETVARLGLVAPTPRTLLVGVATAAVLVGVAIGGAALTKALSPTIAENIVRINAQTEANIGGLAAAAVAAVLIGVAEELLFRGAIQPLYGVFFTALAFAALHTQYGFGVAPLTVFAIGLVLGVARRYANTSATILAHVLFVVVMVTLVATRVWTG